LNLLSIDNLAMRFGEEPVFEGLEAGIDQGENVALVGPNGVGKSTLLKIIAGHFAPDGGSISLRQGARVAYLEQDATFDDSAPPRRIANEAMTEVREAIAEYEQISDALSDPQTAEDSDRVDDLVERQHELQARIERLGGWEWEHRVDTILDQLGILDFEDRPLGSLSGGQRRRVALARVLLKHPDLLLLDEPTNHLDPATSEWLEEWLIEFPGATLFVSHDRYFLERVADRIMELDPFDGLFVHPDDFQTFIERKHERRHIRQRTQERRRKKIEQEIEWLDSGVKSQGRNSKDRRRELEEMARKNDQADYQRDLVDMEVHKNRDFGVTILEGRGLHVSRGDKKLLEGAHIQVTHGDMDEGDKIGLLGPNGCGKTTLIHVLRGENKPDAGRIERGSKTDTAFMTQDYAPFDPDATVYDAFSQSDYVWLGDTRHHKRDYLERFLFDRDDQKDKVSTLSGGQIRRLQLAKVMAEDANLLILDEPTNDLDIPTVHALEEALQEFDGCAIIVSHDRYFLNRVCNTIVAFEDRKLTRYEGDYDDYRARRDEPEALTDDAHAASGDEQSEGSGAGAQERASQDLDDGEPEPLNYREQQELDSIEQKIVEAEQRKEELEAKLNDPDLYSDRADEIEDLNRELRKAEATLEELYSRWTHLSERAEA
jgi:ATP-binding cassette subfamily F protein uup